MSKAAWIALVLSFGLAGCAVSEPDPMVQCVALSEAADPRSECEFIEDAMGDDFAEAMETLWEMEQ